MNPPTLILYVLSLVTAIAAAEFVLLVFPIFVGSIIDTIAPDAYTLSLLAAVDLIGIAIASLVSPIYVARINRRRVLATSLVILAGLNILSILPQETGLLIALRLASGLAAGTVFSIAVFGVATSSNPDRNSGFMVMAQVVLGAGSIFALSLFATDLRLNALFALGATAAIVAAGLTWFAGIAPSEQASDLENKTSAQFNVKIALAIVGTAMFFFAIGAVWAYVKRIGLEASLESADVSHALSFSYLISFMGSLFATVFGLKFGRITPFVICALVQIPALFALSRLSAFEHGLLAFFFIIVSFQFFWTFIVSYQLLTFAGADPSGKFSGLFGAASHAALASGSFIGAWIVAGGDYSVVPIFGVGALVICYASFVLSNFLISRAET